MWSFGVVHNPHKYDDMFDAKLKPRMLNYLLTDHLPCEEDVFLLVHVDLQKVVDIVRVFGLVSEEFPDEASSKLIEDWAAAVDAWCHRLVSLVTCSRARSCWIGTFLMGMTCQECSSDRFSTSYAVWLEAFLSNIYISRFGVPPSGSVSVRAATCASLTDLLIRLGRSSNLKEDGTNHAERVIQPVLELLDKGRSEAVLEAAVNLLCTIMEFFPEAIQRNFDNVEVAIISKIVPGQCSSNTLKIYAHCLALLPKTRGDEESWLTMIQYLITSINLHLNELFHSLEEGNLSCPIEGLTVSGEAFPLEERRSKQQLMTIVPTLMLTCCQMLTYPYPVQVTVPVDQLLKLVERVLEVRGSYSEDSAASMMITRQELMCAELPILHLHILDVLTALIKGARSQLMPFAESIIGFLKPYFRKCTLPLIRIKVYSVIRTWLTHMNNGASLQLAEEVINNAIIDLDPTGNRSKEELYRGDLNPTNSEASVQPGYKKRKHIYLTGSCSSEGHQRGKNLEVLDTPASRGLKIAALEALETLLTMDGALSSECLRADADSLLINVATNAYEEKLASKEDTDFVPPHEPTRADFVLAALRSLLASLLSPHVNPDYQSQGLELFRKGRGDAERIALFCAHALLALELRIHPREDSDEYDVPYASRDSSVEAVDDGLPENLYAGGHENKDPIPTHMPVGMAGSSKDDELHEILLGVGQETEEPSEADIQKDVIQSYQEDLFLIDGAKFPVKNKPGHGVDDHMEEGKEEGCSMLERNQFEEPIPVEDVKLVAGISKGSRMEYDKVDSGTDEFDPRRYDTKPEKDVLAMVQSAKEDSNASSVATIVSEKAEESETSSANDSAVDSHSDTADKDSGSRC